MARVVIGIAGLLTAVQTALGAGALQGVLVSDGVTGRALPNAGWRQERVYVGQLSTGFGAGAVTSETIPGSFFILGSHQPTGWPMGTYSLFAFAYDGIPALSMRTNVNLPAGASVVDVGEFKTAAHYSVMYNQGFTEWGDSPWVGGTDFYQTFVATHRHVTRIATRLAGKGGDHQPLQLNFAVYETNAGPPSTWQQISPTRAYFVGGNVDPIIHIFWVAFKSSEVTLEVGQTYAVRIWRDPTSASPDFALVARTDGGTGYANGHLYAGNTPLPNLDAYCYVSGGAPGTIVNHTPVLNFQLPELVGSSTRHGQTFRATGTSLAAVNIVYATGQQTPAALPFVFQCYSGVGGAPVGPPKTCYGVPGFFQARAAAMWLPGEVPLTPNNFYYLEWTSPGSNTWALNENDLPGNGYLDRVPVPDKDLAMSIAEYEGDVVAPPVANFTATPTVGPKPLTVQFTDQSTGEITARSWIFGDGSASGETNPTHTYLQTGTYTVTLIVFGPGGNDSEVKTAYITVKSIVGDFDNDNDVDQTDFAHLQLCFTGQGVVQSKPECADALLDDDSDVDAADFAIFLNCMKGPNKPVDPDCAG
jgi:hypothetical protein